ncbi:alpha-galactosidase [Kitasatospora sp. NPDC093806]|uniref:alpha-galactosidase n=1 Tax=Kitasatospora sp. NPDC093806 TaxID=3155075 RepID=UPI00342A6E00
MRQTWAALLAAALSTASLALSPASPQAAARVAPVDVRLALTPPMGWNGWNAFACEVDERVIQETADKLATSGLRSAGYDYVNLDDCWMSPERDAAGDLVPDPVRFPHGLRALSDYLHARGLKLGIYESAGVGTCAGYPGSLGHEQQDANSFAAWGVDYLKYDNCRNQGVPARQRYQAMSDALAATGRPIVYGICNWGLEDVAQWGSTMAHLWRTTTDIVPTYEQMLANFHDNVNLADGASPGAWNDPDMLEIGNGLTAEEARTHFSLWATMAAPLIAGTDLRTASPETLAVLGNTEVIAVDQDRLGKQGRPVRMDGGLDVLAKPLADGSTAVTLVNETDRAATVSTTAADVGLRAAARYTVRDLWKHSSGTSTGTIAASLPAHGSAMFRVTPQ